MKTIKRIIISLLALPAMMVLPTGCEAFLDKTEDAGISKEDIFKSYPSFQGFVDPLYFGFVPYLGKNWGSMDFGDDVISAHLDHAVTHASQGDYWWFVNGRNGQNYGNIFRSGDQIFGNDEGEYFRVGIWDQGWETIRRANIALEHIDMLTDATEEEHNLLLGQIYFMRAWSYFEMARVWGGLPYLEHSLNPNDDMKLPRLSMRETFLKIAEDFKKASEYLPWDWNETQQGIAAPDVRYGSVTKGGALGMYARTMLYLASPWIVGLENRDASYEQYDLEYCKEAAAAAYEVISSDRYQLVTWDKYLTHFATSAPGAINVPYSDECVISYRARQRIKGGSHPYMGVVGRVHASGHFGGQTTMSPTLAFANMFETQNGLAIEDDPTYDPQHPFANRDPRMRTCLLTDGVKFSKKAKGDNAIVQLYSEGGPKGAGWDRVPSDPLAASMTGFLIRKYMLFGINNTLDNNVGKYWYNCPYMRLPELYLIYAEAMNEIGGPQAALEGCPLTAVEAVNIVRRRVKLPQKENMSLCYENEKWSSTSLPDVNGRYLTQEAFRERIRNERSVELAFEGHRFHDIRRWFIAHKLPKEIKALDFKKGQTNFRERTITERVFEFPKHYLFPFHRSWVQQYAEFTQNPGWE